MKEKTMNKTIIGGSVAAVLLVGCATWFVSNKPVPSPAVAPVVAVAPAPVIGVGPVGPEPIKDWPVVEPTPVIPVTQPPVLVCKCPCECAQLSLVKKAALPPTMPDKEATPGEANPDVTQGNIKKTICVPGWTARKGYRPTTTFTNKLKQKQLAEGPYKSRLKMSYFEEDHLISLELGGCPTCEKNLWPQPWTGTMNAHDKDKLENALHKDVCLGKLTLKEAHEEILDWQSSYHKRFTK
jgi:hypothetical protein